MSNKIHQNLKELCIHLVIFGKVLINGSFLARSYYRNNSRHTGSSFLIHPQFVSHPLIYRLLNERWNYGLPSQCLPGRKLRLLLYIFTIVDTILTPVLFPVITYAFYRDQISVRRSGEKRKRTRSLLGLYLLYKTRNDSSSFVY